MFFNRKINFIGHIIKTVNIELTYHTIDASSDWSTEPNVANLKLFFSLGNIYLWPVHNFCLYTCSSQEEGLKGQLKPFTNLKQQEHKTLAALQPDKDLVLVLALLHRTGQSTLDTKFCGTPTGYILMQYQQDET